MKTLISLIALLFLAVISFGQIETETDDDYEDLECVRSLPEPILLKEYFPDAHFEFLKKERKGIETASFGNGGRLTIENQAVSFLCCHFILKPTDFRLIPITTATGTMLC